MTRNFPRIFFLVAIVAASSLPLLAQQFATLNVIVTDPSGKLVPNARVALKSTDTGVTRSQIADRAGLAVLTALTAGDYALKVESAGFSAYERPLALTVGQVASVTAQLGIASVKESVSVSESSDTVETQKTESSQVIHPGQIENLPIAGRDFIDFVLLTPAANVGRSTATAAQSPFLETVLQLSFGGLRRHTARSSALTALTIR
jgi:hypothetical protein